MSCNVRVEPSQHQFSVESGETVLDAALRQGVGLPYGCRNGFCGACRGKVAAGQVGYAGDPPPALRPEDQAAGYAMLCKAHAESDLVIEVAEVAGSKDLKPQTYTAKVARKAQLAHDVVGIYLKLPEGERMPFLAGQYIDILLEDGRRRAFSLANPPHDDEWLELHIRLVPGGQYTHHVFAEMAEGEILRFEGPLGSFCLREDSQRPSLFVGGGTGFAPLKGILEHAFSEGVSKPLVLYWGARAKRDLYLDALPEGWAREHGNFSYVPVLSQAEPEDAWQGRNGWVHEAVVADYPDLSGYDVYMSGPPPMIEAAKEAFFACGLPEDRLFSDAFEYAKDAK